ncbi:hypothetical protein HOLleu_05874 [Holothuria leucospilota]|uniref:Kazal-like domain-containing protein n=1 Tax=Holothuria leucospilota TaxID=206669 RepID=A0A9Q1CM20_HOLLE|nr:hypothetical protein HOLleu_05874 [Holothuria leucospilota]
MFPQVGCVSPCTEDTPHRLFPRVGLHLYAETSSGINGHKMRVFIIIATVLILASLCVEAKKKKDKGAKPATNCHKFQKQCDKGKAAACRKLQRLCSENQQVNQQVDPRPAGISDCPTSCKGAERAKVCGTNGQTYYSECLLRKERCRTQSDLEVAYLGKCSRYVRPASQTAGKGGGDGSSSEEDDSEEGEDGQGMQVGQENEEIPGEPEVPEGPEESVMQGGQITPNDPEQEPEQESQDPEMESQNPEGDAENPEGESQLPEGESQNPDGESQVDAPTGDGNSESDPGRTNIQEFPEFP